MKFKATVLIILVAAVVALVSVKGIQNSSVPENSSPTQASQSSASLIEGAKQQGLPAWLLFHSTS